MKYPQHILAVNTQAFMTSLLGDAWTKSNGWPSMSNFILTDKTNLHKAIADSLFAGRRQELEENEDFLQLLPYMVLYTEKQAGSREPFVYQRAKGQGESRLLGKHSVGLGGHMDWLDVSHNQGVIDVPTTLDRSLRRELREECFVREWKDGKVRDVSIDSLITADANCAPKLRGIILDRIDAVGRVHVGIVYTVKIPQVYTEGEEVQRGVMCSGDGNETRGWENTVQAVFEDYESWSRIVLSNWNVIAF